MQTGEMEILIYVMAAGVLTITVYFQCSNFSVLAAETMKESTAIQDMMNLSTVH
jgi:hypothetical protein